MFFIYVPLIAIDLYANDLKDFYCNQLIYKYN